MEPLFEALNALDIAFFGGIFPGIISGNQRFEEGVIIKVWNDATQPFLIKGLDEKGWDFPYLLPHIQSGKTLMLTLVDGLTTNIADFLISLYHIAGNSARYFGGGAGSLSLKQMPCVFTNEGVFQDAAIICLVNQEVRLGVKHGWQKVAGPLVATRTDKNVIHELNWQPAFEVYKGIVEEDSGRTFMEDNFFDIAKGFPFGIFKENQEDIVRDPIAKSETGALICVGEVPENTVLNILKGESEALIHSAAEAALGSSDKEKVLKDVFVVDCISRVLFLEERFPQELQAIRDGLGEPGKDIVPEGILSLGEISSYSDGLLEFFNKTIVVGSLY